MGMRSANPSISIRVASVRAAHQALSIDLVWSVESPSTKTKALRSQAPASLSRLSSTPGRNASVDRMHRAKTTDFAIATSSAHRRRAGASAKDWIGQGVRGVKPKQDGRRA